MSEFKVGDRVTHAQYGEGEIVCTMAHDGVEVAFEKRGPLIVNRVNLVLVEANDTIEHPVHYTSSPSGVEVIQFTEHMNFCLGNVVKYTMRADHKGSPIEDLKKARWYLEREIARRESV